MLQQYGCCLLPCISCLIQAGMLLTNNRWRMDTQSPSAIACTQCFTAAGEAGHGASDTDSDKVAIECIHMVWWERFHLEQGHTFQEAMNYTSSHWLHLCIRALPGTGVLHEGNWRFSREGTGFLAIITKELCLSLLRCHCEKSWNDPRARVRKCVALKN